MCKTQKNLEPAKLGRLGTTRPYLCVREACRGGNTEGQAEQGNTGLWCTRVQVAKSTNQREKEPERPF